MKKCPSCEKIYDDTWSVCLSCRCKLVEADGINAIVPEVVKSSHLQEREIGVGKKIATGASATLGCLLYGIVSLLGLAIHVWTIVIAFSFGGLISAIVTLLFPVIGQIYWGIQVWIHAGTFFNYYCLALVAYPVLWGLLALGAIAIAALLEKR